MSDLESNKESSEGGVTVVLPVYNEKEGLKKILPRLVEISKKEKLKILIVDDGSVDGSCDIIDEYKEVQIIRHAVNRGYGAAIRTSVKHSNSDWILMMDSDGQHNPEDIPRLLAAKNGCDMVVGARAGKIKEPIISFIGRTVLSKLTSYVCGRKVTDFNSGLRLFKRDMFMRFMDLYPDGFSISTTMTVAFLKAGYKVKYIEIRTLERSGGPSKVSLLKDGASTILLILRVNRFFNP